MKLSRTTVLRFLLRHLIHNWWFKFGALVPPTVRRLGCNFDATTRNPCTPNKVIRHGHWQVANKLLIRVEFPTNPMPVLAAVTFGEGADIPRRI